MSGTWRQSIFALPGVGLSLLPKLACPACWPAYAGLLSSLGLGFLVSTVYLLPLTVASLVVALAALAFRARRRRGHGPFVVGLGAGIGVFLGKFFWESNFMLYGAIGMLIIASLWNAWPRRVQQVATYSGGEAKAVR